MTSKSSEARRILRQAGLVGVGIAVVALGASLRARAADGARAARWEAHAGPTGPPAGSQPDSLRMDGEFGLYVGLDSDSLDVRWITATTSPGFAKVLVHGQVRDSATSPAATGHAVLLRRPHQHEVVLEYGSTTDTTDRHRTTVVLDDPHVDRNPVYDAPDSLYVLGDIHGRYDNLIGVLQNAGLIGPDLHWTGSKATVVAVGDLVDRGMNATKVVWFLYRLEREAAASGGRLVTMLGDHEIMVMVNDLRYTRSKERLTATLEGIPYWKKWEPHRSVLGRWLASRPALVRVGNVLLCHGGLSYAYARWSPRRFEDSLSRFLDGEVFRLFEDPTYKPDPRGLVGIDSMAVVRRNDFFFGASTVFWYRGYVQSDTLGAELAQVLHDQHAAVHVVGHTPLHTIRESYGDSLIAVDLLNQASEMLLMVRDDSPGVPGGWRRYRIREEGPPEPLDSATATASR